MFFNKGTVFGMLAGMAIGGITALIQMPGQKMAEERMIKGMAKDPELAKNVAYEMTKQNQISQKTK